MRPFSYRATRFSWIALAVVLACHKGASSTPAPTTADAATAGSVSEANVVAIILAANNTDLSYARLVPARSRSSEVKAFAQRMLTDHALLA